MWITAYKQKIGTHLTPVALQVEVLLQGNNSHCLFTSRVGNNRLIAAYAKWRETTEGNKLDFLIKKTFLSLL